MTDSEIIKALECCTNTDCDNCKQLHNGINFDYECKSYIIKNALDLINRQKAEIENLKVRNEKLKRYFTVEIAVDEKKLEEMIEKSADEIVKRNLKELRAEAIREFAELVKENHDRIFNVIYSERYFRLRIDELVEEMTEVQK